MEVVTKLEENMTNIVTQQVDFINSDLDTLRSQNVIQESERNPELRERVTDEVRTSQNELARLCPIVDDVMATGVDSDMQDAGEEDEARDKNEDDLEEEYSGSDMGEETEVSSSYDGENSEGVQGSGFD